MPASLLNKLINVLTPRMVSRAVLYHLRTAAHLSRMNWPALEGLAGWQMFLKTLFASRKPVLPPEADFIPLGDVVRFSGDDHGRLIITTQNGTLYLLPLADNLLLLRVSWEDAISVPFSYSVIKAEDAWPPCEAKVTEYDDRLEYMTKTLKVVVSRHPCTFSFFHHDDSDWLGNLRISRHANGQVLWQGDYCPHTAFYGLGSRAHHLNLAGGKYELWNRDPLGFQRGDDPLYMSIPFLMTLSRGMAGGLFFDNPYRAWVDIGIAQPGRLTYRALNGGFNLYLIAGSPQDVLARYTELTGRTDLLPLWALGFQQSRWSYYPAARVLQIAEEFRRRRLPCDAIHLDIHYMDDYRVFTWHPQRFPDPSGMITRLHNRGFKVVTIIDPGVKVDRGYKIYEEGLENGYFITYPDGVPFVAPVWPGDCHFPDFSNPRVRYWWGENHQGLFEDGVDGIWNDMNEPALITGIPSHVADIVHHDKDGQGADHAEIHNLYALLEDRATKEGWMRLRPQRRPLIITRSGWAGIQRYSMHWTGDNKSDWDQLKLNVQMLLNLGLSGVPVSGADIGGFEGGPSPELYVRWMQVGAFTPFFRVHSMQGSPDQEPWAFGEEVEAICRQYLELRYRLLPYHYTALWQATQSGAPLLRPMFWLDATDEITYAMDDQFLYGDSLLIAPVMEAGSRQRSVYLPRGLWYDFWTNQVYAGGKTITVAAPLERLPIFIRGGTILPLWPLQQYVGEKKVDELTLRVYWAAGTHTSLLYEDDGEGSNYLSSQSHRLSEFVLTVEQSEHGTLKRQNRQGSFPLPYRRLVIQVVGRVKPPATIELKRGQLLSKTIEEEIRLEIEADEDFELILLP